MAKRLNGKGVDMRAFALKGAEARLIEIESEAAIIRKVFRMSGPALKADVVVVRTPKKRKRRTMSAANRAAVSKRMRKYWAARRAGRV